MLILASGDEEEPEFPVIEDESRRSPIETNNQQLTDAEPVPLAVSNEMKIVDPS